MVGELRLVKRCGVKSWMAVCPAHEDRRASLHVWFDGGRLRVYCHAGCRGRDVFRALGMTAAQLTSYLGESPPLHPQPDDGRRKRTGKSGDIVRTYDYRDERGKLLYQVCRLAPKNFLQRRPDGSGGWLWNLDGTRRVLYRLPELFALPRESVVWVVEGEKDADRLAALGLHATTNCGGAGKWRPEYAESLCGHRVAVVADNDDAGRKHAVEIERSLRRVAKCVVTVELPGVEQKGDVSDWLDAGGTTAELFALARAAHAKRTKR